MNRPRTERLSVFGWPPVEFVQLTAGLGCGSIGIGLSASRGLNPNGYRDWSLRDDSVPRREMRAPVADTGVRIGVDHRYHALSSRALQLLEINMAGRVNGKVAVITGAASGMGKATAELFVAQGAKVICADISGKQDAVAASLGPAAVAIHCDVAREDDVRHMIGTAEQRFGQLDILVNNAGFGGGMKPLHEQTTESWDRVHSTNIRSVFFCMKYGVISMMKSGGGSIVNIGSATGVVGWKHHSIYGAAKAGVHQLTRAAALDYANYNIRVNAIAPGTMWTGMVEMSKEHATPPPGVFRLAGIPMDRWGLASDIANAVLYLASDEAAYVTGVVLPVDGGYCIGFSGMGAENRGPASINAEDK